MIKMVKCKVLGLVLLLGMLLLTGCGGNVAKENDSAPSQEMEESNDEAVEAEETFAENKQPVKEFSISEDDIVENLNVLLKNDGYKTLENLKVLDEPDGDGMTVSSYNYGEGCSVMFSSNPDSEMLTQIYIYSTPSKTSDDTKKAMQFLETLLIKSADSNYEDIMEQLQLMSTTDVISNEVEGEYCVFSYTMMSDMMMFTMNPK